MSSTLYHTKPWRELRERVEVDAECALSKIAGNCLGDLQLHHIEPVADGGDLIPDENGVVWLCKRHHRALHGFLNRQRKWKSCHHHHRSAEARLQCERRLNAA